MGHTAPAAKKLFLLDAMALVYRSHFAFAGRPIQTSRGFNTSAIFGFANTLVQLITEESPTHLAVVFDTEAPTERHSMYGEYKANRQIIPEELSAQIAHVKRFVAAMRVPLIELDGYEADDIIGTLACRAEREGFVTYMVTPDKDFGQLVTPKISIYRPSRMGDGVEVLGPKEVCARWGISRVEQVVDVLALMGDASDNILGVPGIGEKTAAKLLAQFDNLENLLASTAQLKGKQKENLETYAKQARLSKRLAVIRTDAPVQVNLEDLARQEIDQVVVQEFCVEFELNSLGRRLLGDGFRAGRGFGGRPGPGQGQGELALEGGAAVVVVTETSLKDAPAEPPKAPLKTIADVPHQYHAVTSAGERRQLVERLRGARSFGFDLETDGMDPRTSGIVGISFALEPGEAWFVSVPAEPAAAAAVLEEFRGLFENPETGKVGHNLKFDLTALHWNGIVVKGPLIDTMIMHALVEPELRHGMDFLSEAYLGYTPIPISRLIGEKKGEQRSMREVLLEEIVEYACEDVDVTLQLRTVLEPMLRERRQERVYFDIEAPLLPVLVAMEAEGVTLDTLALAEVAVQLESAMTRLEATIYELGGGPFNLNSPKQLGEILFGKLNLGAEGKPKKTRTGQFSTREETLVALAHLHPIVQHVLDFREAAKLKSTYVDALPATVHSRTRRIHTTFHQVITATGRLASSDPNLQNIPIRSESGREIRKAFVARDDRHLLLSADYSQIELRIIAALSGDPHMLEAFASGEDIHQATAARVYGVPLDQATPEMRRKAKMVNFGIIYGISAFGLAQRLGIPRHEASQIIEAYFRQYPGVRKYMDDTIAFAREHGFVETITGRRRYLRDIRSANQTVRSAAERTAINTPIQGTAADMIKIAMAKVHQAITAQGLQSKMILQVHDELVFEIPVEERDQVIPIVEHEMKHAIPTLKVPIVVEIGTGRTWLDAH